MIEMEIATGGPLPLDISQHNIPTNLTPMHRESIGSLVLNKIAHRHFHHFHAGNLAYGNSHRTKKFPNGTTNANPSRDAIHQGIPMQQSLAVDIIKIQVEEVLTKEICNHTAMQAPTLCNREFIWQMLLVLYTLKQSHCKIITHTVAMILILPNFSFHTLTATPKRIIMFKTTIVMITQSFLIRTMNMIQLDMKRYMVIRTNNTLINALDNHLCWRQWHLKNGVIMLTKCHTPSW